MKQTKPLIIETDLSNPNKIFIHPNDGYDLKLYSLSYAVKIFFCCTVEDFNAEKTEYIEGEIILSNDMKPGKVKINKKFWEKIGKPEKSTIYYENNKILLLSN